MSESLVRIELRDRERRIFRFLDEVDVVVPSSGLIWRGENVDAPGVRAACMYGYMDVNLSEVAYVLIGDVTGDSSEPEIRGLDESPISSINALLEDGTREFCEVNGFKFVRWMNCNLNFISGIQMLVSAYIVEIDGIGQQQRITCRFSKDSRKWFIETAFSVALADSLAKPMFRALHPIKLVSSGQKGPI